MQNVVSQTSYRRPATRIYRFCSDYALASWGNVFIVIWRQNTTLVGASNLRSQCEKFALQHPEGVLLLTVIHDGAPAPASAERAQIASFLKSAEYIRGSAVVMEGTSFRAAFVRGVVTGLTMLAHQPFPHQVCSMAQAGALFARVTQGADVAFEPQAFERGIAELRGRIERDLDQPGLRKLRGVA